MRKPLLTIMLAVTVALSGMAVGLMTTVQAAGQANVTPAPEVPTGDADLGTVRIPRRVMANGAALAAGTYRVRLTAQQSQPEAVGQTPTVFRLRMRLIPMSFSIRRLTVAVVLTSPMAVHR